MENIILFIISVFFVIGAVDYFVGNKLKLGIYFEDGIKTMGPLAISMVGIISLTPIITIGLEKIIMPISKYINLDPSIFISSIIAVDMGAFNIAKNVATSDNMVHFSGVLMASILGCTLSFTLPLALGIIKKDSRKEFFLGILFGIIVLPVGLFVSGVIINIPIKDLIISLIPLIIIALLMIIGILYFKDLTISIFSKFSKFILFLSIFGFAITGFQQISGIVILKNLMPLKDTLAIVGNIAIFLGGAYVMLEIINRCLNKYIEKISKRIGVNNYSIAAFIGSFASAIIVFTSFDKLDDKGKILCSAFSVAGAYVLGGQLGFVASEAQEAIPIYIFTKLFCGVLSLLIATLYLKKKGNSS